MMSCRFSAAVAVPASTLSDRTASYFISFLIAVLSSRTRVATTVASPLLGRVEAAVGRNSGLTASESAIGARSRAASARIDSFPVQRLAIDGRLGRCGSVTALRSVGATRMLLMMTTPLA
jgi:hypothetical protein